MRAYFLDTSALLKRYVSEAGSKWTTTICQPSTGNVVVISQATLTEAVASFCRKAREQDLHQRISEAERDRIITKFRADAKRQYNVVRVTSSIYTQAGDLCRTSKLRAYDAIQLACALKIRTTLAPLSTTLLFVSADIELLNVARTLGLETENPNTHL